MIELSGHDTRLVLTAEEWNNGISRLVVHDADEIPFLCPALAGHHFFTGEWPQSIEEVAYEPHVSASALTCLSPTEAVFHQPMTPYTGLETAIRYAIADTGVIDLEYTTVSHAASYPYGYVGLFWATLLPKAGQRGFHTLVVDGPDGVRWQYFCGHGDSDAPDRNTILGPGMPSVARQQEHPPTYFLAEAAQRFALPIQVGRWRDLHYCLMVDSADIAFTDVLMGTAVGGQSWDMYWTLEPGQTRTVRCRLVIGQWPGWEAVEASYRQWDGCVCPAFRVAPNSHGVSQPMAAPLATEIRPQSGLDLSMQLFEQWGRPLLQRLDLLDRCAVVCLGGTSQNAGLDDEESKDHVWGPYLSFLMERRHLDRYGGILDGALREMPDEVHGIRWIGYDGPEPRETAVWEASAFLKMLTGLDDRPATATDWIPLLCRSSFLGRSMQERLFDAEQGRVLHDPGKQFTTRWRHLVVQYLPPDIHRALLARSLFRVWNAGPEYNLSRMGKRGDQLAFRLCLDRYLNEVLELAFCWNEEYVPQLKWRARQAYSLPIFPQPVRDGIAILSATTDVDTAMPIARDIDLSIKKLMKDLYHVDQSMDASLSSYAHAIHAMIEDPEVRNATVLEW